MRAMWCESGSPMNCQVAPASVDLNTPMPEYGRPRVGLIARAHPDDPRIGRRDGDRADRAGADAVGDRRPRRAGVRRFPESAAPRGGVHRVEVIVRRRFRHGDRRHPGGRAERPDVAEGERVQDSVERRRLRGRSRGGLASARQGGCNDDRDGGEESSERKKRGFIPDRLWGKRAGPCGPALGEAALMSVVRPFGAFSAQSRAVPAASAPRRRAPWPRVHLPSAGSPGLRVRSRGRPGVKHPHHAAVDALDTCRGAGSQ